MMTKNKEAYEYLKRERDDAEANRDIWDTEEGRKETDRYVEMLDIALKALKQPKTGHWIQVDSYRCRCDQCEIMQFIAMYSNGSKNYCPNCGCRMVEPQESEE